MEPPRALTYVHALMRTNHRFDSVAARYPNNRKSSILSRLLLFAVSIAIFLPIDRNDSNPAECRIVEFSLNRSNRGNWKKRNDHKIFSILFHRNFTLIVRTVSRNISQIVPDKGEQKEKGRRTFVRFLSSREIAESFGQRCNETRGD